MTSLCVLENKRPPNIHVARTVTCATRLGLCGLRLHADWVCHLWLPRERRRVCAVRICLSSKKRPDLDAQDALLSEPPVREAFLGMLTVPTLAAGFSTSMPYMYADILTLL